jgi:hypothetical protein
VIGFVPWIETNIEVDESYLACAVYKVLTGKLKVAQNEFFAIAVSPAIIVYEAFKD